MVQKGREMSRRKKKKGGESAGEAWLLPYSDLMTLLLAVFIVLFAVSKVDQAKATEMSKSFQKETMVQGGSGILPGTGSSLGIDNSVTDQGNGVLPYTVEQSGTQSSSGTGTTAATAAEKSTTGSSTAGSGTAGMADENQLQQLQTQINQEIVKGNAQDSVATSTDDRGVVITFKNVLLFDSGKADIKSGNSEFMLKVAKLLNGVNNYVRVEGNTDNIPIQNSAYPSNWELSTARATSVVRFLIDQGGVAPERLCAVGYGEYRPIADNSTEAGRNKNRRIEIVILNEQYSKLEEKQN